MTPEDRNYLAHHGILGMKWGVRRYQNYDGTLTTKGKTRQKKIESNSRLAARTVVDAAKATRSASIENENKARRYTQAANRLANKNSTKYSSKIANYTKKAKESAAIAKEARNTYSKIVSGQLKAGKDYIMQTDVNSYGLYTRVDHTYIATNKKSKNITGKKRIYTVIV